MFEVAMEDLKKVFKDFYTLTKFMLVLYDSDRKALFSYPEKMCEFCQEVRTNPILFEKCIACDNRGFDMCDAMRKPYIYRCHMGVIEAIAPIYSGEMSIGYLMFGQIATENKNNIRLNANLVNEEYNINLTENLIEGITVSNDDYIAAAVNMMTMCANYLYANEIIKNNPNILAYQMKEYIKENLSGDLSVATLCQQFYISQSKLYKFSKRNFKMGISDYVRTQRIKKAQKLLSETDLTVAQISEAVGIFDVNYFIRAFKKQTGITPLRFRSGNR